MFSSITRQIEGLKEFNQLDSTQQDVLLKELRKIKLFTPAHASAKLAKNKKFKKYDSYILYMSPATLAFKELGRKGTLCPWASEGCQAACLNTAGRGRFNSVAQARLRKALYYIVAREHFVAHLFNEIESLNKKAVKSKKQLVLRINGTTDIQIDKITYNGSTVFETFPSVQFYDYTKSLMTAIRAKDVKNWHVTFSASETNNMLWDTAIKAGINVAMVFDVKPKSYNGVKVINGDEHDLRFLDTKKGVIVGLTAKGKAKHDSSGFVKRSVSCSYVA